MILKLKKAMELLQRARSYVNFDSDLYHEIKMFFGDG